jgi:hypothetical protein
VTEENHDLHKVGMGKLYEKYMMAKNLSDMLDVAYSYNTETKRNEIILIIKDGERTIPLGNLWSAEDFALRDYKLNDSLIMSRVFKQYESVDERSTLDEFNDEYHPVDKNYDDIWTFIDGARQALDDTE